eukprot:3836900-Prymnesium_polylepis.1
MPCRLCLWAVGRGGDRVAVSAGERTPRAMERWPLTARARCLAVALATSRAATRGMARAAGRRHLAATGRQLSRQSRGMRDHMATS